VKVEIEVEVEVEVVKGDGLRSRLKMVLKNVEMGVVKGKI
jgi:hypothetical protein